MGQEVSWFERVPRPVWVNVNGNEYRPMYKPPQFEKEIVDRGIEIKQITTGDGSFYAGQVRRGTYIKTTRSPLRAAWWMIWHNLTRLRTSALRSLRLN